MRLFSEVDRVTAYCDIKTKKFTVGSCKMLHYYPSGDALVRMQNGVEFTARAEEIFNVRIGDYHEQAAI